MDATNKQVETVADFVKSTNKKGQEKFVNGLKKGIGELTKASNYVKVAGIALGQSQLNVVAGAMDNINKEVDKETIYSDENINIDLIKGEKHAQITIHLIDKKA